jgi:hypothetical protein
MGTTHLSGLDVAGVPTFGIGGAPMFTGHWYFVDAVNGNDGNTGAINSPLATIYVAYSKTVSGNNDVVVIVGNGGTTGTQRLSVANAQIATPSATTGTLTWANNATHLIGMTAPTATSQRARIAPPSTTYTQATFASGNFVVVSGQGCYFANFSVYNGFTTGGTNQIAWTDSGGRNFYYNVDIQGMADAASAVDTGSRSLLLTGTTGENTFEYCTIGTDTVTRTVANASVEFAAGTPRNTFRKCHFPFQTSSATVLGILGTGASCMDRWQSFEDCVFINNIKSTSTQMTVLASLTSASPGGLIVQKNSTMIGITKFGDTNALANTYIDGGAPTAATSGVAVNPT